MKRRQFLLTASAVVPAVAFSAAAAKAAEGDNTPLQFIPKTPADPAPLDNELEKYPACPHCGMNRRQWHHSRHLIHYEDNLAVGTCSLHCAAVNLAVNLDRGPKAIYAADFGSAAEIKPLVEVTNVVYLVGSKLPGTMTKKSKMAFADKAKANAAMAEQGGGLMGFDEALQQAYLGMAEDTAMIRKRRAERRAKAAPTQAH